MIVATPEAAGEAGAASIRAAILRCVSIETLDTSIAFGGKPKKGFTAAGFDNGARRQNNAAKPATRTASVGLDAVAGGGATTVAVVYVVATVTGAETSAGVVAMLDVVASLAATGDEAAMDAAPSKLFPKTTRPLRPTTSMPPLGNAWALLTLSVPSTVVPPL